MTRMFYLSFVYDADGYNRYDMLKSDSLEDLDNIISKFKNSKEVINEYLKDYNIDKKKGRVCIVYEDMDLKKRELDEIKGLSKERQDDLRKQFTYAHIIPVLYKNRRLMNTEACIITLKRKLREKRIIDSIMYDKEKSDLLIKCNKKYIFETEEEQDFINNEKNYREAIECFLRRIAKSKSEDQYFYFRSLVDVCSLSISTIKTKAGIIKLRDGNVHQLIHDMEYEDIMNDSDRLEEETIDMDTFYLNHDLDEVILLSPNKHKPIGSTGRRIK